MTIVRLIVLTLVIASLLIACSPNVDPAEEEISPNSADFAQDIPTNTVEPPATEATTAVPKATKLPTETATIALSPTPILTETPEESVAAKDACLDCHNDKEKLIETAAPEEKAPSESSGVG